LKLNHLHIIKKKVPADEIKDMLEALNSYIKLHEKSK